MEQAHPTGCLNTKKSAKIPLSIKKMVLSLTATSTAGNFPGQIYFYTAGFELFGRGHGHLATLPWEDATGCGGESQASP